MHANVTRVIVRQATSPSHTNDTIYEVTVRVSSLFARHTAITLGGEHAH